MTSKKLPKAGQVLSFFIECLVKANPTKAKCLSNKTLTVKEYCDQIKQIWTHHFVLGVISGKDQENDKHEEEKRKMIVADRKIKDKVLYIQKKSKQLDKWSKNPKKSSKTWFLQKEKLFKEMLDLLFNILLSDAELFNE